MSNFIFHIADDSENPGSNLPGQVLSAARKKQKLRIEDVAVKLCLDPAQVKALENNQFDAFSAPIFVSGHLKNYAKLLAIPVAPIINAYEAQEKEEPPIISDLIYKGEKNYIYKRSNSRIYMALLVIFFVCFVLWFVYDQKNIESSVEKKITEKDALSLNKIDLGDENIVEKQSVASSSPVVKRRGFERENSDDLAANRSNFKLDNNQESRLLEPEISEVADTLFLNFSGDSWVEISESSGRRVFYDMGRAGQQRVLSGKAPFLILLGKSSAVELKFNGQIFNHSRYSNKNDIARFSIEPSDSTDSDL